VHDVVSNPIKEGLQRDLNRQRRAFLEQGPLSVERRAQALDALAGAVLRHGEDFAAAVAADFGHRSAHETGLPTSTPWSRACATPAGISAGG
jgi:coniferyl-aldehyde dehydrogenase